MFAIQNALVTGLLHPALLARLREAETRVVVPFRLADHFDRMTRILWGEVGGTSPAALKALEGPSTRRDVQRAYVDRLASLVVSPPPGTPDDARALARLQLSRIDGRAARTLSGEAPVGDYVRAHLLETRARIKRAAEAGRDADAGGSIDFVSIGADEGDPITLSINVDLTDCAEMPVSFPVRIDAEIDTTLHHTEAEACAPPE